MLSVFNERREIRLLRQRCRKFRLALRRIRDGLAVSDVDLGVILGAERPVSTAQVGWLLDVLEAPDLSADWCIWGEQSSAAKLVRLRRAEPST